MRRLVVASLSLGYVAADCQSAAFAGLSDPGFAWLVKGTAEDRKGNVTKICASVSNPDRDNFNAKLSSLTTACIPPGDETSAFALTLNLLNSVLCEKKEADFCLLSLLPLFDMNYFMSLVAGGTFTVPPLQPVVDDPLRFKPLCASPLCNAFVEQYASAILGRLAPTNDTSASEFIRTVVKSNRCACAVQQTPCYGTAVTNNLIAETAGVKNLVDTKSCDAKGVLTACSRTWINCEALAVPPCGQPCSSGILASITFRVKNLDYTCLKKELVDQALHVIRADVIANVPGLLDTDFGCDCAASVAPATGTECKCTVKCVPLATLLNFNLTGALETLKKNAAALVVPMPHIDSNVLGCQITPSLVSFGESFEIVSVTLPTPPPTPKGVDDKSPAFRLSVFATLGLSVFAASALVL